MTPLEIILLTVVALETAFCALNIYFVLYHERENRKYLEFLQELIRNGK